MLKISNNYTISNIIVFKIWLFANVFLSVLGLVASFFISKLYGKNLKDTLVLTFFSILIGVIFSLPSLLVLLFSKFLMTISNRKNISIFYYFLSVISIINLLYLIWLWRFDKYFFKDWGLISLAFTLTSGILSLIFVFRKNKIEINL